MEYLRTCQLLAKYLPSACEKRLVQYTLKVHYTLYTLKVHFSTDFTLYTIHFKSERGRKTCGHFGLEGGNKNDGVLTVNAKPARFLRRRLKREMKLRIG